MLPTVISASPEFTSCHLLTTDINILQLSKEEDDAFKSIWEFV
jgi:hypothetical protein